jgi:hypothetical protein
VTLTCRRCDGYDIELVDDNGVTMPPGTRIEYYECHHCGHEFRVVLTA